MYFKEEELLLLPSTFIKIKHIYGILFNYQTRDFN